MGGLHRWTALNGHWPARETEPYVGLESSHSEYGVFKYKLTAPTHQHTLSTHDLTFIDVHPSVFICHWPRDYKSHSSPIITAMTPFSHPMFKYCTYKNQKNYDQYSYIEVHVPTPTDSPLPSAHNSISSNNDIPVVQNSKDESSFDSNRTGSGQPILTSNSAIDRRVVHPASSDAPWTGQSACRPVLP